jgi:putative ATPase
MPEARITLSQAVVYMCQSPKSNSVYNAINSALSYVQDRPTIEVPNPLRNTHPEKKNYKYPHNFEGHWIEQEYGAQRGQFYKNTNQGHEKAMNEFHQNFTKPKN